MSLKFRFTAIFMVVLASCRPGPDEGVFFHESEIDYRLDKIIDRITVGDVPRITKDFLLAGLTLDPAFDRRFTNYSGDQVGRYLSAMSLVDPGRHSVDLHDLVRSVIENQQEDGRFGADTLLFDAEAMEGPQMALLWGNGRLLTGLLDYYERFPERTEALESAQRLAGFLETVTETATRPEIIERFKTMGALGYICFTQITEGMVKLYNATGDERYIEIAREVYPLLPDFGNQHSHGFLNTLRGVMMLYEATGEPVHLEYAEDVFSRLVASDNYMITGGVPEFFIPQDITDHERDEGCSEADLFILCLQLWEATGKMDYLDKAEYLFMNHMLFNQFLSGDFGHHVIEPGFGFVTSHVPGQSWWCCNYHGLHALHEAGNTVVTREGKLRKVHLFYPTAYQDEDIDFDIVKIDAAIPSFRLVVNAISSDELQIAIRDPYWSSRTEVLLNGIEADVSAIDGYLVVQGPLRLGDIIGFSLGPSLRIVDRNRNEVDIPGLTASPVTGAAIYGPWLLGVDDVYQNLFMTELSHNNVIYIPGELTRENFCNPGPGTRTFAPEAYLEFEFLKEGTSQTSRVVLRPISDVSFQSPSNVRFWINFARPPGQ